MSASAAARSLSRRANALGSFLPGDDELTILFGPRSFTPSTRCRDIHDGPIPRGRNRVCARCHQSGLDHAELPGQPVDSCLNEGWSRDDKPSARKAKKGGRP